MANELNKLNLTELRNKVYELKRKLAEVRFDKATGKMVDTSHKGRLRKEIARILTRINQVEGI